MEVKKINSPPKWIILVEPWCGDAAPILPFLIQLADLSPSIHYDIQLRDNEPFLINSYLTNGSKSIPKLIVQDAEGNDLFTWGPRPKEAQQLLESLKGKGMEYDARNKQLQNWYNEDIGVGLQRELLHAFYSIRRSVAAGNFSN